MEEFHRLAIYDKGFYHYKLHKLLNTIDYQKARDRYSSSPKIRSQKRKNKKNKQFIQSEPAIAPKQQSISAKDKIKQMKEAKTTIGLGLETNIKIPVVRSSEVKIDKNTQQKSITEKTILYAAGWSLKSDEN